MVANKMNAVFTQLLAFVGRHWLRVGLVLLTLFLLTRKQIDLSVQLGRPANPQLYHAAPIPIPESRNEQIPVPIEANPDVTSQNELRTQQLNVISGSNHSSAVASALQLLRRTDERDIQSFLDRFHSVAQTEQERYGIPASIILANGLLQSQGGTRNSLSTTANYFMLPCTPDWRGQKQEDGTPCLRVYPNAWTSFRDHSLFITTGRFAQLTTLAANDYQAWARGLQQIGYPGGTNLANELIEVIEEYGLTRYDS
ncbi:MAG: glucosaminidase domain-containing protein [Bacteroidota bacterium]